jgi:hypothetical protein
MTRHFSDQLIPHRDINDKFIAGPTQLKSLQSTSLLEPLETNNKTMKDQRTFMLSQIECECMGRNLVSPFPINQNSEKRTL